ncbi:hypothetical protein BDFB_014866, partial [Asbolus verrucosus]
MGFTEEHKKFMLESYFRNGQQVDGEWIYEAQPCFREFREKFPDVAVIESNFLFNSVISQDYFVKPAAFTENQEVRGQQKELLKL